MRPNERFDVCKNRMMCHEQQLSRVTTRMSMQYAGEYTILRALTRAPIPFDMESLPAIDIEKLKADMTACVERTSGRKFSLAATGGKNPDLYRNFMNNGQDKRLTADVFVGIVSALDRNPADYIVGLDQRLSLPNATVLTSTFAMLLDSVGIDPYEDGRAQKLAARFPNALQSMQALRGEQGADEGPSLGGVAPAPVEDQPEA